MSSSARAAIGQPGFVRLWMAGGLLGSMRWMEVLAVGVYTLTETGSAFVVAVMLFARTVPMVLVGAFTGALADRVDRRILLVIGVAVMAASTAALAGLALAGRLALWHVALGALVNGSMWTMEHPVRRALIHDVVGNTRLAAAISLDSASFNGTRMAGPLIGGGLYATWGLPGTYCVAALVYLATAACVFGVPPGARGESTARGSGLGADLAEGFRHVRGSPSLSAVMWVTVVANLFGFSYVSMVPVLGTQALDLDARGIGALMAMEGLGAMLGALALSARARARHYGPFFLGGITLFLVMVVLFALSRGAALSMLALFVAGLGLAGFGVMQSTIVLDSALPRMRSRVMGVLAVCIGTGPLGVLAVGAIAESAGPTPALLLSAVTGLLALAVVAGRWPDLLRA